MTNGKYTYKILEEKQDPLDSVIEKSGLTSNFTLRELNQNVEGLKKLKKQLGGQKQIAEAKIINIEEHHPFTKKLTEQERFTVHMLEESYSMKRVCDAKIAEIDAALAEEEATSKEVEQQVGIAVPLSALDEPAPETKPTTPGGPVDLTGPKDDAK